MKTVVSLLLAILLLCSAAPAANAEPRQVLQGTQVHLVLLNTISTAIAKDGDPFIATVLEPIYLGDQLLIPAGTRVHGVIGTVSKARRLPMFRGQAYFNLSFKSLEIDSRLIPVQMSIIALEQPRAQSNGKPRKDLKIQEGQVVGAKEDVKKDVMTAAIGTGGGTLVGAVFSHAMRGFGIGLGAGAAYVVIRKGKDVELPAQTGILARLDTTITVPQIVASNAKSGN